MGKHKMGKVTINLDTLVSQAIHRPSVDGLPLYTRIDGNEQTNESKKSEKWIRASKSIYSSPNNVRRVFVTGDRVVVQLYKPIIKNGKPDESGTWREIKYAEQLNLFKAVEDSLYYLTKISRYYMETAVNPNAVEPVRYRITGTGLSALSNPWVCSNIEEIYFDWTLLAAEQFSFAGIGCDKLLNSYINGTRGLQSNKIPTAMVLHANSGNITDIRNRFPRLKCVGLIGNLSNILDSDTDKGKSIIESIEDGAKTWCKLEKNIALMKAGGDLVIINELDDIPMGINTNFSIRSGIYKYDDEVLQPYFDSYVAKVTAYRVKQKESAEKATRIEKSDLERALDAIIVDKDDAIAKKIIKPVLMLTFDGMAKSEVERVYREMSSEGEKKYRALMGD